jgi:hypothetical protein
MMPKLRWQSVCALTTEAIQPTSGSLKTPLSKPRSRGPSDRANLDLTIRPFHSALHHRSLATNKPKSHELHYQPVGCPSCTLLDLVSFFLVTIPVCVHPARSIGQAGDTRLQQLNCSSACVLRSCRFDRPRPYSYGLV